jgi:hypothetical protein
MWTVVALTDGTWTPIAAIELPAQPPTSQSVLGLAREHLPPELQPLVRHLAQEIETTADSPSINGRRDAIELWNEIAQSEARELNWTGSGKIEALDEALALYPEGTDYGDTDAIPATLAWHDRTAVIIPLTASTQQIMIEYTPSLRDENRVDRLRHRYATPDHELETILDWRGYFGRESAVVDGWTTMRLQGHGYVASFFGTFGFVVGHAVRRLTRPQPTIENDPTARGRLIHMSEKYPHIADGCPDLSRISACQREEAIVFVHGTVSCGIQGLKDFFAAGVDEPIFRYEHDTFRALKENGIELADLISTRIRTKKLLLAAHSRGGLVARFAADELTRRGYPADVQIFTFGAPHQGTPLAAMAGELLNLLFKLSGEIVNAIPVLTPLSKAYSFLIKCPALPPGIAIMREDSEALCLLNAYGDWTRVSSWGSQFRIDSNRSGFGIFVTGTLLGALSGIPNDLVVPTHSALGFGNPQPALSCSHTQYFEQPEVQAAIRNFYPAHGPGVAVQAAAAGAGAVPRSGGVVERHGPYLTIKGLRVPVKKKE